MANIPLRRGMLLRHQGRVYEVADFQERHTGKQKPTVHVSLHDIRDGRPVDRTLNDLLPIEEVERALRPMQYLYPKGRHYVFMDSQSFEEFELGDAHLAGRAVFLVEGQEYRVLFVDGSPVSVEIPEIIAMKVAMTAPPEHSVGAASNVTKEAALENGLQVRVPLFIKTGDVIRVDTRSKTYAGKDHA